MWFKQKKITELIGYVLTFLSLVYIAGILVNIDTSQLHISNPLLSLVLILVFGALASVSVFIGAYSWKLILEFVNGAPVATKDVYRVYLKSNIAKYLPGNVMHYAGRNYLGSKLGWKNTEMAFSSLLEYIFGFGLTGLIIVLFALVGLVNLPQQFELTVDTEVIAKYLAIGVLVVVTAVTRYFFVPIFSRQRAARRDGDKRCMATPCRFFTVKFLILFVKMFFITLGCFLINCIFYLLFLPCDPGFPDPPGRFFQRQCGPEHCQLHEHFDPRCAGRHRRQGIGVDPAALGIRLSERKPAVVIAGFQDHVRSGRCFAVFCDQVIPRIIFPIRQVKHWIWFSEFFISELSGPVLQALRDIGVKGKDGGYKNET